VFPSGDIVFKPSETAPEVNVYREVEKLVLDQLATLKE